VRKIFTYFFYFLISGSGGADLVLFFLLPGLAVDGAESGVGRCWGGWLRDGLDHGFCFL
jgi:hypothetical protein